MRRPNYTPWIIVAACALCGLFVAGFVAVGVLILNHPPAATAKKTYTRQEFRAAVLGKTKEEVIATIGKPDNTSDSGNHQAWYYSHLTYDPVTGKSDWYICVAFERGICVSVDF